MKTRVYDRRIYISMRKGLSFAVLFMYLEMLAACGAGILGVRQCIRRFLFFGEESGKYGKKQFAE